MPRILVNIDVPDLAAAAHFYREAFGFRATRRLGDDIVELAGAAVPVFLLAKAPGSPPSAASGAERTYTRHWTPVHLDLVVEHLEPALTAAEAAGATREGPVTEHVWGRLALLADPFGNGVCLVEFTEAGYDAIAAPPESAG